MTRYKVDTFDLAVARQGAGGLEEITQGDKWCYILPSDVPSDAQVRKGDDPLDGDAWPLSVGDRIKLSPGETAYLENEAGRGTAVLVLTNDAEMDVGDTALVGGPPGPQRLGGSLASGETLASGASASEQLGVPAAEELLVRAQVSGTAGWSQVDTVSGLGGVVDAALDEDRRRLYVADSSNTVYEFDVSDPENPTQADTLNLSDGPGGAIDTILAIAVDPQNERVLCYAHEFTNDDLFAYTLDVSTLGTLAEIGSVNIGNSEFSSTDSQAYADPDTATGYIVSEQTENLFVVDMPGTGPSQLETLSPWGQIGSAALSVANRRVYVWANDSSTGDGTVWIFEIASDGRLDVTEQGTLPNGETAQDEDAVLDQGRSLLFVATGGTEDNVRVVDVGGDEVRQVQEATYDDDDNISDLNIWTAEQLLFVESSDVGTTEIHDYSEPADTAEVANISGLQGGHSSRHFWPDLAIFYQTDQSNNELETFRGGLGDVVFRVIPLDPNGNRVASGINPGHHLADGVEGAERVNVLGPDNVEVELHNRGNRQATVDHVDVYQE